VAYILERTFCFSIEISWHCIGYLYEGSFAGFSSPRGFPRINAVSLVNVYFSVILFLCCYYLLKCKEL
jgi:hypothetical protein